MYEAISQSQPAVGQRVRLTNESGWGGTEATCNGHDGRGLFTVDMDTATFTGDDISNDGSNALGPYWGCLGRRAWVIVPDGPEQGIPAADVKAMAPTSKQEAEKAIDPKALAPKKPAIQYVPVSLLVACDEALAEGRIKYGTAKWRETKTESMTYLGGALRHIYAYIEGEEIDPESLTGKTHLAGAIASLAILVDCIAAGTVVDNRPPKGPGAELLRAKK